MEMYPQCIPRNFSNLVGLCSVFRRCMAGRLNADSIEVSSKARIAKAPEVAFRGQFLELMEGVEQISNSETVEISRKERRPSRGVFKSVSESSESWS